MLKLTIRKQIGRQNYHFQVEGANLHQVVLAKDQLSFQDVPACGCCGSDNLDLTARKAQQKYDYTSIRCLDCKAQVTFGKTVADPDTHFLRRRASSNELDWQPYTKDEAAPGA